MHNLCWGKFVHLENLLFILCKWGLLFFVLKISDVYRFVSFRFLFLTSSYSHLFTFFVLLCVQSLPLQTIYHNKCRFPSTPPPPPPPPPSPSRKSRWPSWAFQPNEPYGFRGRKAMNLCSCIGLSLSLICQPTSEDIKQNNSSIIAVAA